MGILTVAICLIDGGVLGNSILSIEAIHHPYIDQDQQDEDDDRSLLGEPEAEGETCSRQVHFVQLGREDDRGSKRDGEPNRQ